MQNVVLVAFKFFNEHFSFLLNFIHENVSFDYFYDFKTPIGSPVSDQRPTTCTCIERHARGANCAPGKCASWELVSNVTKIASVGFQLRGATLPAGINHLVDSPPQLCLSQRARPPSSITRRRVSASPLFEKKNNTTTSNSIGGWAIHLNFRRQNKRAGCFSGRAGSAGGSAASRWNWNWKTGIEM